jgi:hypothetical protein
VTVPLCKTKDLDGTDAFVLPRKQFGLALPLQSFGSSWPAGVYALDVAFDTSRQTKLLARPSFVVGQSSLTGRRFRIAKSLQTFSIQRGATMALAGGVEFTFFAHGHAHTVSAAGPGEDSQGTGAELMVAGALRGRDQAAVRFSMSVHGNGFFSVAGNHQFELVGYEYDRSMTLKYYGVLPPLPAE